MSKSKDKSDSKKEKYSVKELKVEIAKSGDDEKLKKDGIDEKLMFEIVNICIFIFALLLLISQFSLDTGLIGMAIKLVLEWFFGKAAKIFPLVLMGVSIVPFITKNKMKKITYVYIFMMFILVVAFYHILAVDSKIVREQRLGTMIMDGYRGEGGFFGAMLGSFFISFLGKTGSILFSIAIFIVLIIILTGKSLVDTIVVFAMVISSKIRTEVFNILPPEETPPSGDDGGGDDDGGGIGPSNEDVPKGNRLVSYISNYINDYDDIYVEDDNISHEEDMDYDEDSKLVNIEDESEKEENRKRATVLDFVQSINSDDSESGFEDEDIERELAPTNLLYNPNLERRNVINIHDYEKTEDDKYTEIVDITLPKSKRVYKNNYKFPSINLLNKNPAVFSRDNKLQAEQTKEKLQNIFDEFNVKAKVTGYFRGPTVTRYEVAPGDGVKVSRISGLADEIALNLASQGIRIEAPIPGKPAVGIEIPNQDSQPVYLREIIDTKEFAASKSKLTFSVGKDIEGNVIVSDIKEMPHLLIAGATGSGKSVCINSLITSIIYKARPEEVKLLMIDPKVVELSVYNGIPHLMIPVVTDPKKAAGALSWAVREMTDRYNLFSKSGVRGLEGYNEHVDEKGEGERLPQIVVIIDELSDLMQTSSSEVEENIKRLSQMARAAGIYLIIATQRPSVDVITGVIKANIPSRLAFAVSSGTDSRTILDMVGAEKLLGRGDMLFYPKGVSKPVRVQGAFISDKEVEKVVDFLKKNNKIEYSEDMIDEITSAKVVTTSEHEVDELYEEAMKFVIEKERASASLLQRQFRVGYNRASRMIDALESMGIVGEERGSKPREVLMKMDEYEKYLEEKS